MIKQELSKIWQSSPHVEQVKFEKSRLMLDVQSNMERFHKAMKKLYFRESLAAIIVIPIFIFYAVIIPFTLTKIASVLIALWAGYVFYVMQKTKKKSPEGHETNYLDHLRKTKEYLEIQKRLRDKILVWYILPCFAFLFLFMLGIVSESEVNIYFIVGFGVFTSILAIAIYLLNKRAAKKEIQPKLNKVIDLIKTLEE